MFNKWIRPFFQFNRQERWGAVLLIGGLFGLYGLASLFPVREPMPVFPAQAEADQNQTHPSHKSVQSHQKPALEAFDPNQISEAEWLRMGIPARTVRTIRNYLEKGGRFRSPEDLGKIWGLKPADRDRLLPYVLISSKKETRPNIFPGAKMSTYSPVKPKRAGSISVDINRSDSVNWEALPGIGPVFARRIIRYRDRLGGFVRIDQIAETYQLPDSVFQQIRPHLSLVDPGPIRKIPLNTVTVDSLGRHPYCNFSMARSIIRYREQHGPFRKLEELLELQRVDSAWWMRMRPYLSVE